MEGSDHESREGRIPGLASLEGAILPPPFTVSAQRRVDLTNREWRDPTMPASSSLFYLYVYLVLVPVSRTCCQPSLRQSQLLLPSMNPSVLPPFSRQL